MLTLKLYLINLTTDKEISDTYMVKRTKLINKYCNYKHEPFAKQ